MKVVYADKSWNTGRRWSSKPQRELLIDVVDASLPESPECFAVRPQAKLNRFRGLISAKRLSHKGWYKRYTKKIVL